VANNTSASSINKKLRIAMLIRHFNPSGGGAERYCVELTKQLSKHHEVHLFAQTILECPPEVTPHTIPLLIKRPRYINQLLFSWQTYITTHKKFDIIHSHDMVTHADIYTLHVPCVKTRWTQTIGWKKWLKWATIIVNPRLLSYLWLERKQLEHKSGKQLIAVSEFLARNIHYNYPNLKIALTLAYPGIHPRSSQPDSSNNSFKEDLNIAEKSFVILFIANDFKKKGLQSLIDAIQRVNNKNVHLVIAGNGKIDTINIPAKIHDNVHNLGVIKDLGSLYIQSDILVHPTRVDTYGMVVLEAMSHRLPVIVSNKKYCGFSEHLEDSNHALILNNPHNAQEISEKILLLYNHPDVRKEIALSGWKKSQTITWEGTARSTLDAYEHCIQAKLLS